MPTLPPARLPASPSTGNLATDTVEQLYATGLLSDAGAVSWQLYLTTSKGKIDFNAIALLAYICQWHRAKRYSPTRSQFVGDALLLTNEHLMGRFQYSRSTAQRTLETLVEHGFVEVEVQRKGDPVRGLRGGADRYVRLNPLILERRTYAVIADSKTGRLRRDDIRRVTNEASYTVLLRSPNASNIPTGSSSATDLLPIHPNDRSHDLNRAAVQPGQERSVLPTDENNTHSSRSSVSTSEASRMLTGETKAVAPHSPPDPTHHSSKHTSQLDSGLEQPNSSRQAQPPTLTTTYEPVALGQAGHPTRRDEREVPTPLHTAIIGPHGGDDATALTAWSTRQALNDYAERHAESTRRVNSMSALLLQERSWARRRLETLQKAADKGETIDADQHNEARKSTARSERELLRRAWSDVLRISTNAVLRDAIYDTYGRLEQAYPGEAGRILILAACRACGRVTVPPLPESFADYREVERAEELRNSWISKLVRSVANDTFDEIVPRNSPCDSEHVTSTLVDLYSTKLDRHSFARRLAQLTGVDHKHEKFQLYVSMLYNHIDGYYDNTSAWRHKRDVTLAEALADIAGTHKPTLSDFQSIVNRLTARSPVSDGHTLTLDYLANQLSQQNR